MSGFKVFSSGLDLDDIFSTRIETDPSTALVPFVTPSGQNLSARYLPYTTGNKASVTGFKFYNASGEMQDVNELYALRPYSYSIGSSVTERRVSSAGVTYVSLTFVSMDTSYAFLGNTSSVYNAGQFIVNDSDKLKDLKVVMVSGGGGAGCSTGNSAAGGGGGAVHIVDASFANNTSLNINVGNGGIGAFVTNVDTGYPASRGGESRVTVGSGTAIINNVNYTSGQFYTAGNSGWAGTYGVTYMFDLSYNSARGAGAGSGGGGGAHSNFSSGIKQGGSGSGSGSDGGDSETANTLNFRCQPSGGGGGGGASAPTNSNKVLGLDSNPSVFSGNGRGATGSDISSHTIFGTTFYGGGGGAAQPSNAASDPGINFLMAGTGGLGGGGAAFRTETGTATSSGGSGTNGLGGGGGGVSAAAPASGVWSRTGGNGGHGTVVINFRLA